MLDFYAKRLNNKTSISASSFDFKRITRPDTQLPQSRAGGQGPYLRTVEHFGRSGIAKNPMNAKKVSRKDRRTDGPTDQQSGVLSCVACDLKKKINKIIPGQSHIIKLCDLKWGLKAQRHYASLEWTELFEGIDHQCRP